MGPFGREPYAKDVASSIAGANIKRFSQNAKLFV
jgi:hypothetical protein